MPDRMQRRWDLRPTRSPGIYRGVSSGDAGQVVVDDEGKNEPRLHHDKHNDPVSSERPTRYIGLWRGSRTPTIIDNDPSHGGRTDALFSILEKPPVRVQPDSWAAFALISGAYHEGLGNLMIDAWQRSKRFVGWLGQAILHGSYEVEKANPENGGTLPLSEKEGKAPHEAPGV